MEPKIKSHLNPMKFLLKRKSDGWYLASGGKHTSDPTLAIELDAADIPQWAAAWLDHSPVPARSAKEVTE